jgi:hypothetical protein
MQVPLQITFRNLFDAMRRQLEHYARRRGRQVKSHETSLPGRRVDRE